MASLKSYLSVSSLNVNGLNAPIKQQRVADWIKRNDPSICCLQETHFEPKDAFRLRVKGWSTIFYANGPQKKAGVAILIWDRLDFKLRTIVRDAEGHYIILKGSIQQVYMTIIKIYAPNRGAARYTSQHFFFLKVLFIYLTEIETASERGNTSRGSGRGRSRLIRRSPMWASIP